jgi:E3 ubiquitin-protein ligase FANCL
MELPSPGCLELGDITGDCAICYAYHLPACAPVCDTFVQQGWQFMSRASCPKNSLAHKGPACSANGNGSCVPEHSCENEACGRPYHAECLQEWLRADPSTRQSFNTLFGACPYCAAAITVQV